MASLAPPGGANGGTEYERITDVVAGPNLRWRDNLFQALFIAVATVIGVGVGLLVATREPSVGAAIGGVAGLVGGTLLSGVFLMIYRGARHLRGR